jgi:two-component system nitrogen regulation sensor histidine kinase NtrY
VQNIRFEVETPQDLPILNLDRRQIRQVLINLVENAISSIHGEGCIRVILSYHKGKRMLNLEVSDNGSGISDEHKIRIFEPDFSTKATGMGLGLTIVHSIISDHHGTIRVEDNQPSGARFIIELPVPT